MQDPFEEVEDRLQRVEGSLHQIRETLNEVTKRVNAMHRDQILMTKMIEAIQKRINTNQR